MDLLTQKLKFVSFLSMASWWCRCFMAALFSSHFEGYSRLFIVLMMVSFIFKLQNGHLNISPLDAPEASQWLEN